MTEDNVGYSDFTRTCSLTRVSNVLTVKLKKKSWRHTGEVEVQLHSFSTPVLDHVSGQLTPQPLYPPGKEPRYLEQYRRFEGKKNLLSLPEFEPRPVQPLYWICYVGSLALKIVIKNLEIATKLSIYFNECKGNKTSKLNISLLLKTIHVYALAEICHVFKQGSEKIYLLRSYR
jgi:hypothetical protein